MPHGLRNHTDKRFFFIPIFVWFFNRVNKNLSMLLNSCIFRFLDTPLRSVRNDIFLFLEQHSVYICMHNFIKQAFR